MWNIHDNNEENIPLNGQHTGYGHESVILSCINWLDYGIIHSLDFSLNEFNQFNQPMLTKVQMAAGGFYVNNWFPYTHQLACPFKNQLRQPLCQLCSVWIIVLQSYFARSFQVIQTKYILPAMCVQVALNSPWNVLRQECN